MLPESLWQLRNLRYLHLDHNHLNDLPSQIGQLRELRSLELSANCLKHLPAEIGQLRNLRNLFLSQNMLSTLPEELGQLPSLLILSTDGNPLTRESLNHWTSVLPTNTSELRWTESRWERSSDQSKLRGEGDT